MRLAAFCIVLTGFAMQAVAEAPERSPRPEARPVSLTAALVEEAVAAGIPRLPQGVTSEGRRGFAARSPQATAVSLRPLQRPRAMVQKAMARQQEWQRGAVCGDPDLQGEAVGYVPGRIGACGIDDAVKLRSVSGVALSQQALVDCQTAKALKRWVDRGVKPAVGNMGGGVERLHVAAHYICRTRNNQPGAKVSEHGRGRAIDIAAIHLRDGSNINVLRDWHGGPKGRALQKMHRSACGIFTTTLGPGSDGFHEDHLHYDTARRGGAYCR